VPEYEPTVNCPWCEDQHGNRYLCDPVKAYLDAIVAKAGSYTLPDVELNEPVELPPGLGDVLMRQFVVNGGTADVGGVRRPVIVITGRDAQGEPLPRWTFIGTTQELQRIRNTFDRMVSLAIDTARKHRQGTRP